MSISAPGGAYGYLRIYGFDTLPGPFITELMRLIPLLPDRGLIIDLRGNPGGYIWAAELALQLFTPKPIQPTRFSVLATPFTRDMADLPSLRDDLVAVEGVARRRGAQRRAVLAADPDHRRRGVQLDRPAVRRTGGVGRRLDHVLGRRPVLRGIRRQRHRSVRVRR